MSDPRYVIVDLADYSMMMPAKRTNLPDAPPSSDGSQHIHVTRHPDGTITATPMLEFVWRLRTADELRGNWWVDCPTGGDQ